MIAVAATASATPSSSLLFDMSASPQAPIGEFPDRKKVAGRPVYRIRILIDHNEPQPSRRRDCNRLRLSFATDPDNHKPKNPLAAVTECELCHTMYTRGA
jgi:hypothetical protein